MQIARSIALALPLTLLPGLTGCIAVAHADYSDYEETYEVVALEYAEAAAVARTIQSLGDQGSADGRWKPVQISVDTRTNSLVLKGQQARVDELIDVISELDTKVE